MGPADEGGASAPAGRRVAVVTGGAGAIGGAIAAELAAAGHAVVSPRRAGIVLVPDSDGRPGELAGLVSWLASERCSFSTGATFDLSGARAVY